MARRSDHTREELEKMMLDEARRIVNLYGFEGLTVRKLAEAIGYAPGTIYNVFESLDDLYLKVNGATLDALYEVLAGPSCNDPDQTAIDNMKSMAEQYRRFCRERRNYWLMLFTHRLPVGHAVPDWYQSKIEKLFDPLEHLLKDFYPIQGAHKQKMAARILWSSVHGLCFLEQTGKFQLVNDETTIHEMMGYLIDSFVRGIHH